MRPEEHPSLPAVVAVRRARRLPLPTGAIARRGRRLSPVAVATVRRRWHLYLAAVAAVRRRWHLYLAAVAAGAIGLGAPVVAAPQPACVMPPMPAALPGGAVIRVVDGDTIHVRSASRPRERVRLLGIDAPEVYDGPKLDHDARASGRPKDEIRSLGRESTRFARRYLTGAYVRLELDAQTRDQYGRLLAYVWLPDGQMFNVVIVREGYAQVLTIPPNVRYAGLLLACQREARDARRGLWGK